MQGIIKMSIEPSIRIIAEEVNSSVTKITMNSCYYTIIFETNNPATQTNDASIHSLTLFVLRGFAFVSFFGDFFHIHIIVMISCR